MQGLNLKKPNLVELSSPVLMFLWATWFLLFNALDSNPLYRYGQFLSNYQWALIFMFLAIAKALTILFESYRARQGVIVLSIVLWSVWVVIFATGSLETHAVPVCLYFVYQSCLSFHKLSNRYAGETEWSGKK